MSDQTVLPNLSDYAADVLTAGMGPCVWKLHI